MMPAKLQAYSSTFFLASICLALVAPSLFSDGMFMDGLIYAAVSKNMAEGLGTFWQPHLSQTLYSEFFQHPPLALGLQAFAFKFFGSSFLIERFYSLFTFLLSGFLITKIWKQLDKPATSAWIPLLFWFLNPLVIWAVANNMLENTMQIFVLFSVWSLLKFTRNEKFYWLLLAGFSLFLGLLTKGFVALFPLSFFFWLWLFQKKTSFFKASFHTGILFLATILPLLILLISNSSAHHSLYSYLNIQVITSLTKVQTVDSRFFILFRWMNESLISFGILLLIFILNRKKIADFKKTFSEDKKFIFLFFAIGFSGVLPIMISLKQSGFYMLSAFPFFAIGFALLAYPFLVRQRNLILLPTSIHKYLGITSFLLFFVVLFFGLLFFKNKVDRDQEQLHDVYAISKYVGKDKLIAIPQSLAQAWSLHAYFARYATISLDDVNTKPRVYFLSTKGEIPPNPDAYQEIELDLQRYSLFKTRQP